VKSDSVARPSARAWKLDLMRAFFVWILTGLFGMAIVQWVVWPATSESEHRLLMDSVWAVALIAAGVVSLVEWMMRPRVPR
jgi:uncharacterized membrane protein YvlD (DUF360 family)